MTMLRLSDCMKVALFVAIALANTAALAVERPQGLLWNRSGLPATLPLQIKTNPGSDYLLHLVPRGTDKVVLAAYVRGGEFFRVLVPPGQFHLHFASGPTWHGETRLFGSDTILFALGTALTFDAKISRKEGHLVDLRDLDNIAVKTFALCQRRTREPDPSVLRDSYGKPPDAPFDRHLLRPLDDAFIRFDIYSGVCG